jgi:hypothetical protein
MGAPTRGSTTSNTQIQIDWSAPVGTADGGSTILGYAIYTDSGTNQGTWTELAGETSLLNALTYTQTSNVAAGTTYYFKVKSRNKWGWGPFSTVSSILAATTPSQVTGVATQIDAATGGITLAWAAPASNGGVAITSYTVEIRGSDTTFRTDPGCDGSTSTILNTRTCTIPMATFVAADHSLAFDALVEVRVTAVNIRGSGPSSTINTAGARIRQIPAQMTTLPTEGTGTSNTQVQVDWTAVTGSGLPTGNSAILSY